MFVRQQVEKEVAVPVALLHAVHLRTYLQDHLRRELEERCIVQGYVQAGSVEVVGYSAPRLLAEDAVFIVTFTCACCLPKEGDHVVCVASEVTKAGVRGDILIANEQHHQTKSPVMIFVSRDLDPEPLEDVQVQHEIPVVIMGIRFELNDKYISAIARVDTARQHG